jgi:hypothetical protein
VAAVKTGDVNAIADAVQALKDNPGRRAQEAADIRGNGRIQSSATVPSMTMGQQFAVPGSVPGGLNALAPLAAAPTNAMLAPPVQAPLSLEPSIPGIAPGTPVRTTKPPDGYRVAPNGGFEIIPGGPADPAVKAAAQTATSQGNAGHECMRTIDRAFHASTYRPARTPSPRFGHPPLLLGVQIGAITVSTDTVQQLCHSSNLQFQKYQGTKV